MFLSFTISQKRESKTTRKMVQVKERGGGCGRKEGTLQRMSRMTKHVSKAGKVDPGDGLIG